jgi:translation elongation factor EF-Tu-like GTPase
VSLDYLAERCVPSRTEKPRSERARESWVKEVGTGAKSLDIQKPVGMEKGVRFAIREGGKTVGAGLVTEVVA